LAQIDPATELIGATSGRYVIRWFYKLILTGTEKVVEYEFELLALTDFGSNNLSYCMIRDLREEGIAVADLADGRAVTVLRRVADHIETATGRFFYAKRQIQKVDGSNSRELLLGDPIIALEQLNVINQSIEGATAGIIDLADVFVYNRHLTEGLFDPDDRENPKLAFVKRTDLGGLEDPNTIDLLFRNRLIFPIGSQNVETTGVWGYTSRDPRRPDNQVGITPPAIRDVALRIAYRETPLITDQSERESRRRGPLQSERTLHQSVSYGGSGGVGRGVGITGDQEIDQILAQFARPLALGAA
jgi:hypothetical protein